MLKLPSYVIVTPARNEVQFIESTIQSVVAQTVRPLKWIIVSDGSTDGTDEIVQKYSATHEWIELHRMPERQERHFGGKALAFNSAQAQASDLPYEAIANLDADITLPKDYFAYLLQKLAEDPKLGLIGTPTRDETGEMYDFRFTSLEEVTGTCQLFRRECFQVIGGYVPSKRGNIDTIACIAARIKGWKTHTFTDLVSLHHRKMGTAQHGRIRAIFNEGVRDHTIGNHPLWQLARIAYQMTRRPFILRGLALGSGFLWASIWRYERPISRELIAFHRREQLQRLAKALRG